MPSELVCPRNVAGVVDNVPELIPRGAEAEGAKKERLLKTAVVARAGFVPHVVAEGNINNSAVPRAVTRGTSSNSLISRSRSRQVIY